MSSNLKAADLFDISGWVTVVTGGGSGLGRMMANCLAQNGAKVYITGRRADKLAETAASSDLIIPVQGDSTKKEDIERIVAHIASNETHVDLLINNSGVSTVKAQLDAEDNSAAAVSKRMMEQSFDDWTNPYAINVAAIYFTTAAFLPLLVAKRQHKGGESGNVINVTSISGLINNSQGGQFSYNANKRAAVGLTNQLALELARPHLGIRVNQLALGYFPSEMSPVETQGEKDFFRRRWQIPFGRAGKDVDLAVTILALAKNEYQTNSCEVLDGAYSCASDNLPLHKYL
ncbi:hypothetical protein E3P99_02923 [Wallemia hederae]|uniref:Ketoreductase (KR) domain-containing protein n=1 Tax=Wallemia hederae TaxID=1540922 RepID=A0A4T0FJR3_9BASI|nr:hypothetical protein E3P99_02923 [Wallemia hederae]